MTVMDERVLTSEGRAALLDELLSEVYHVDTLFDLDDLIAARPDEPAPATSVNAVAAQLLASIDPGTSHDVATPETDARDGMSPTARSVSLLARRPRVVDPQRWQDAAVCVIDPRATNAATREDETRALAMCALCPVRVQCRAWADSEPDFQGVAGGAVYGDNRAKSRTKREVA